MGMRRYTRLTNAHSKKLRNHTAALGLFLCFYNSFITQMSLHCRLVASLPVYPTLFILLATQFPPSFCISKLCSLVLCLTC